eukprot:763117-Hanusia_phi.AAC.3
MSASDSDQRGLSGLKKISEPAPLKLLAVEGVWEGLVRGWGVIGRVQHAHLDTVSSVAKVTSGRTLGCVD